MQNYRAMAIFKHVLWMNESIHHWNNWHEQASTLADTQLMSLDKTGYESLYNHKSICEFKHTINMRNRFLISNLHKLVTKPYHKFKLKGFDWQNKEFYLIIHSFTSK
jgi:hypothetical protein